MLKEFIKPEIMILAVVLYAIGAFLKLSPKFKNEWSIPYILLGISVILTPLYVCLVLGIGWSAESVISAIIQGILIAALTVFANQLIKQVITGRILDKQKDPTDKTLGV